MVRNSEDTLAKMHLHTPTKKTQKELPWKTCCKLQLLCHVLTGKHLHFWISTSFTHRTTPRTLQQVWPDSHDIFSRCFLAKKTELPESSKSSPKTLELYLIYNDNIEWLFISYLKCLPKLHCALEWKCFTVIALEFHAQKKHSNSNPQAQSACAWEDKLRINLLATASFRKNKHLTRLHSLHCNVPQSWAVAYSCSSAKSPCVKCKREQRRSFGCSGRIVWEIHVFEVSDCLDKMCGADESGHKPLQFRMFCKRMCWHF